MHFAIADFERCLMRNGRIHQIKKHAQLKHIFNIIPQLKIIDINLQNTFGNVFRIPYLAAMKLQIF